MTPQQIELSVDELRVLEAMRLDWERERASLPRFVTNRDFYALPHEYPVGMRNERAFQTGVWIQHR
jgi:hypothetical protein